MNTFRELRNFFGGSDPYMTTGHQILKTRTARTRIPNWAQDSEKIKEVLLRSFPKLETNPRQRTRAGRWLRVIFLHYRQGFTIGQVAQELNCPYTQTRNLLQHIRRAFSGYATNGSGPRKRIKS